MTKALCRSLSPLCIATALATAVVLLAPHSVAQTEEDRAAARSLATQGITAYNEGRHAAALDLFTRAESLLHAPPHVLYMARCAARLGQLVRAHELYLKLGREELPAAAPQAFRDAQTSAREEAQAIAPRLANLVINVKLPAGLELSQVRAEMDSKPISTAVLGVPIPADPGKHQISASAPGYKSRRVEVTLADGGRGVADVLLEPSSDAVPAPLVAAPASTAPSAIAPSAASQSGASDHATTSNSPGWMRPVSYVAMGVGVLGLGAGTYFGLKSRGNRKDADDLASRCGVNCSVNDPLAGQIDAKDNTARNQLTYSIVSFAVGGLGAVTGVTLYVLSSRKPNQTAQAITPYIGWGAAGLSGTW